MFAPWKRMAFCQGRIYFGVLVGAQMAFFAARAAFVKMPAAGKMLAAALATAYFALLFALLCFGKPAALAALRRRALALPVQPLAACFVPAAEVAPGKQKKFGLEAAWMCLASPAAPAQGKPALVVGFARQHLLCPRFLGANQEGKIAAWKRGAFERGVLFALKAQLAGRAAGLSLKKRSLYPARPSRLLQGRRVFAHQCALGRGIFLCNPKATGLKA